MENITLTQVLNHLNEPGSQKKVVIQANGASMVPTIVKGDRLQVLLGSTNPKVGEIVLAQDIHGNLIIHRVVSLQPSLVTQGDAKECPDEPIAMVFGTVTSIEKTLRSRIRRWKLGLYETIRSISKLDV